MSTSNRLDELFTRWKAGDAAARDELFGHVYTELHTVARAHMARQRASHTLQPTALVNEALLKLGIDVAESVTNRGHFQKLAGRAMRQILVDHARSKALRPTEPATRIEIDEVLVEYEQRAGGMLQLDAALARLEKRDPELVQLVELRFFAGRTMEEVAEIMGISPRSAARRWEVARVFLRAEVQA